MELGRYGVYLYTVSCRNMDLMFRTVSAGEQCQMKVQPDFYSLPRDGQTIEEHLCDEQRRVERGMARSTVLTALLADARGDKN